MPVYYSLTSYEKIYSFIDLDGCGCHADVKRSASIAKPDHGDTTKRETQGGAEADFSAAKESADAGSNRKQQSYARQKDR